MPDITVFKMEIDDPTFNAPFGGRTRSDGTQTTDESSGRNVKLVAGLGTVFLLTGTALAFLLKRRLENDSDDDNSDDDNSDDDDSNNDENDADDQSGDENEQEDGGIKAIIGLSFLIVSTAVVRGKIRAGSETASRKIHRSQAS